MDFIERIFGISPDGGTGASEFLYVAAIAMVAVVVGFALYRRARMRRFLSRR